MRSPCTVGRLSLPSNTVLSAGKHTPSKCFLLTDINSELEAVKVSRKSCGCLILCCPLPQSLYNVLPLLIAVIQSSVPTGLVEAGDSDHKGHRSRFRAAVFV